MQVQEAQSRFMQHHVQPIVIFFGALSSASAWLTDMEASGSSCSLPVLLDEQRAIYGRFGLRRSRSAVFAFDCLALYADELLQGRALPKGAGGVAEDVLQMGGDFVVARDGRVHAAFPSKTSLDRPSVDRLLRSAEAGL